MGSRAKTNPSLSIAQSSAPIGIFDSGIGGLTVLKAVREQLPCEDLIYFGDTARVPYGTKSKETITRFSIENTRFLQGFGVKLVIVACNTASSLSLEALKRCFPMPVIGVIEPGAKEAIRVSRNRRIGVIGTKSTIGSGAYEHSLRQLKPDIRAYSEACPLFVPFVEEGWTKGPIIRKVAKVYLDPLRHFGIDTLILGCTHYPLLKDVIQETIGRAVRLVNSAEETARCARHLLKCAAHLNRFRRKGSMRFYVSDEPEHFRALGERFLGTSIQSVAKVPNGSSAAVYSRGSHV